MRLPDGQSRGFGFVTFSSPDSVQKALSMGSQHDINGKTVEIKPAVPREDETLKRRGGFGGRGGYGGFGGGGGYGGGGYGGRGGYGGYGMGGGGYGGMGGMGGYGMMGGGMVRQNLSLIKA